MSYLENIDLKKEEKLQEILNVINEFQSTFIGSPFDKPFCYSHEMGDVNKEKLFFLIKDYIKMQKNLVEYKENEIESKRLDLFYSFLINLLETYK